MLIVYIEKLRFKIVFRVILVLLKCMKKKNMKVMPNDGEVKGILFV